MTVFSDQLWKTGVPCFFDCTLSRHQIFARSKEDTVYPFISTLTSYIPILYSFSFYHGKEEDFVSTVRPWYWVVQKHLFKVVKTWQKRGTKTWDWGQGVWGPVSQKEPERALPYDQRQQNQLNSHLPYRNHKRAQGQVRVLCTGWKAWHIGKHGNIHPGLSRTKFSGLPFQPLTR